MRLEPCDSGPTFWVRCRKCGRKAQGGKATERGAGWAAFADLDGEPFVDYYCADCVNLRKDGER